MLKIALFALALVGGTASAQAPKWDLGLDKTESVLRFAHSLGYPQRVKLCAKQFPDRATALKQAEKAWKRANKDAIAEGRQALLDESRLTRRDAIAAVEGNQQWLLEQWAAKAPGEMSASCQVLLGDMASGT